MASVGWAWMAEVAGEELAKLEAAHPGRFAPLKAELERLIAEPGFDADPAAAFPPLVLHTGAATTTTTASDQPAPPPAGGPLSTQESSTRKRKPGVVVIGGVREREDGKRRRGMSTAPGGTKRRAEMAIERAERCLERICAIKRSLHAAWVH